MDLEIRPYGDADLETLRALVTEGALAPHFDKFQGPSGLEHKLHDQVLDRGGLRLAFVDGAPAGFAMAWRFAAPPAWAMLRVGVSERFRRRGVGTALARSIVARVREDGPARAAEVSGSAWMPNAAAEALAARLGFVHERWFWLMERPRGGCPAPEWPADVAVAAFDGSDAMQREWLDGYNDAFSRHYRFHRSDLAHVRELVADPTFRPDGLLLARRGGTVAGFCRCELHAGRGEVGTLGVVESARGIGLGRALLRWGVCWLVANQPLGVTLLVDGENENALRLYRSEGFEVARTREIWTLP